MPTDLPYAADAQVSLSYDELEVRLSGILRLSAYSKSSQVLRLQYQKEVAQSHITVQTKFNYAWGLVKSPVRDHQVEGVRLLQGMSVHSRRTVSLMIVCYRHIPNRAHATQRVSILSCARILQNG